MLSVTEILYFPADTSLEDCILILKYIHIFFYAGADFEEIAPATLLLFRHICDIRCIRIIFLALPTVKNLIMKSMIGAE